MAWEFCQAYPEKNHTEAILEELLQVQKSIIKSERQGARKANAKQKVSLINV